MVLLPDAPGVARLKISGITQGQKIVHIMHVGYMGDSITAANCKTIADGARAAYNTNFASLLNNLTFMNYYEVTDLSSSMGASGTNTVSTDGTGALTNYVLTSSAAVVSWKQGLHYKGGHPRTYFPIRNGADITSGRLLTGTYSAALAAAAKAFMTAINAITLGGSPISLGMVSYWHNKALRVPPKFYAFTDATVGSRVDTQRRRLGRES
jgi:hypothetical protein